MKKNEKQQVAWMSVGAAVVITTAKLIVGIMTGSLGILSEALHSGLDLVAAVITCISVHISDRPADKEHHFGHGKVENFSALIETILLLVTCLWIIYEATHRLATGKTQIEVYVVSYVVVAASIIIDVNRSRILYRVAKKYNSQALEADALHFSTDIWSSAVVLLGLICAQLGFFEADSIAALIVAGIVVFVSFRLGKKAIDVLLDKAPNEIVKQVETILGEFPEVKHFHSLKVRSAGAETFIKVNIHLNPSLRLLEVHQICDHIEKEIERRIPKSETYLHAEPQTREHVLSDDVADTPNNTAAQLKR